MGNVMQLCCLDLFVDLHIDRLDGGNSPEKIHHFSKSEWEKSDNSKQPTCMASFYWH